MKNKELLRHLLGLSIEQLEREAVIVSSSNNGNLRFNLSVEDFETDTDLPFVVANIIPNTVTLGKAADENAIATLEKFGFTD